MVQMEYDWRLKKDYSSSLLCDSTDIYYSVDITYTDSTYIPFYQTYYEINGRLFADYKDYLAYWCGINSSIVIENNKINWFVDKNKGKREKLLHLQNKSVIIKNKCCKNVNSLGQVRKEKRKIWLKSMRKTKKATGNL